MNILVNTPIGTQEILPIGLGGGYFDLTRVLWDERLDGPMPPVVLGSMTRVNDTLIEDKPNVSRPSLTKQKAIMIDTINDEKEKRLTGGFTYKNKFLHTDDRALARLNGMLNRIQIKNLPDNQPIKFRSRAGDIYNMTVGIFKTLYTALVDYLNDIEENSVNLISDAEAATDQTALDAIDITVGWPT